MDTLTIKESRRLQRLKKRYVRFCKNPLRNDDEILTEFAEFSNFGNKISLGFQDKQTMVIKTDKIYLSWLGEEYYIGTFLIYLKRKVRSSGYVDADFWFANLDNYLHGQNNNHVLHPHIYESDESVEQRETGEPFIPWGYPCMPQGSGFVAQLIMRAHIPFAVEKIIEFLNTYNHSSPYREVTEWREYHGSN